MTDLERLEAELTGGVETTVQPPAPELKESIETKDQQVEQEIKEEQKSVKEMAGDFWGWFTDPGDHWSTSEPTGIRDMKVDAELPTFATDPKSSIEYFAAPVTGAIDTGIGLVNMASAGSDYDIPQLPKFENQGAQTVRDLSSIFLPGAAGYAGAYSQLSKAQKAQGALGAFARDPAVQYFAKGALAMGTGAVVDYAAPMQGEGDTALGALYSLSPRHMGFIPEDLRVVAGDSEDDIRRKNMIEGAGLGAFGYALEGVATLARGQRGIKLATEYIPENELAGQYFAKNKPAIYEDSAEAANAAAARASADLDELGTYNYTREVYNGYDPEQMVIFGKDKEMYSFMESGIRTADDMGIVGAAVDVARINGNIDTVYGRVRNPISEGALKFSLDSPTGVSDVIGALGKELDSAGMYGYRTGSGKLVSSKSIADGVDRLAADMLDMDVKELKRVLGERTQMKEGIPTLDKEAAKAVKKVLDQSLNALDDVNALRAAALMDTSFAGQLSDLAWASRIYGDTEAIFRLQEQMLDKIEFLQTLRGMTNYSKYRLVRDKSTWSRLTGVSQMNAGEKYSRGIADQMTGKYDPTLEAIELIQADSKQFVTSLREIAQKRPNFLKPMAQVYELTDGEARSVHFLNNYLRNKTGVLKKAFVDGQPEIPSIVMQGFWSTTFNSALNGIKTPLKAGVSNLSVWALKPASELIGAAMQGNMANFRRSMYAYGSAMETITRGNQYAKNIFVRSAQEPQLMRSRDEIVYKTDGDMELMESVAKAAQAEGNDGPMVLYEMMKNQKDLAEHPWLRIGNRGLIMQDAWQQAVNASFTAKLRAWDEVTEGGTKPLKKADADELEKKIYAQMFDENGIIKDQEVITQTQKQTFSQDNPVSKGFQDLMQRIPGLKPFFMFTRSPVNATIYDSSFQPVGAFIDKTKKFEKAFDDMPEARVRQLLQEEGVDVNTANVRQEYTRFRNDYKGRSAIGMGLVMMGVYGWLSGNITGRAGLYDTKKQKIRRDAGWKPMTAFGVDYSNVPAVNFWLGTTIDILDNASEKANLGDVGEHLRALGYVIGANLVERTQLQNIEQFSDILKGDPAAAQRWAANTAFTSSSLVAGALGTFNAVISPQTKAIEATFRQQFLNRIPGKPGLEDDYQYIEKGPVGWVENPLLRIYNAVSPFKYSEGPSKAEQYLIDVEFNAELGMSSRSDGAPYTRSELAQIKKIMGEDGYFKSEILRIQRKYPAAKFESDFRGAQAQFLPVDVSTFGGLHAELAAAQERAKARAEAKLPDLMRKKREESYMVKNPEALLRRGNVEGAAEFLDRVKSTTGY